MLKFTGGDLEGVTKPMDMKYMKLMRWSLGIIQAWPHREIGEHVSKYDILWKYYIFAIEVACILPGLIYVKNNTGKLSFFDLGHNYITLMMNFVAVSRLLLIFTKSYQYLIADFVHKIHLFHFRDKSEHSMKVHLLVHKMSHYLTLYIGAMMTLGVVTFSLIPIYQNYASGAYDSTKLGNVTLVPSVYYSLPFDHTTNYRGYFVVFTFNWYIAYICSTCFCTFDCLLSLLVIHIWGHLKILTYSLENFVIEPKTTDKEELKNKLNYDADENRRAYLKLRDIVIYHHQVIEYSSRMSDTFGYVLFIYYGFHQASGCLLLLECSQLNSEAILKYGPLTVVLFQQLIQMSVIFELLGVMSEKLATAVYIVPWELMNTGNRKIVHIMLRQAALPLNVKALDMLDIGCRTMAAILKTTVTYFVMLRTLADPPA